MVVEIIIPIDLNNVTFFTSQSKGIDCYYAFDYCDLCKTATYHIIYLSSVFGDNEGELGKACTEHSFITHKEIIEEFLGEVAIPI